MPEPCTCIATHQFYITHCPCHCHKIGEDPDVDSMMEMAAQQSDLTILPYGGAPGEIVEDEPEEED